MLSVLASEEQGRKDCNTGASERGGFTVPLHVSHLGADSFDESSPPKAKALAPSRLRQSFRSPLSFLRSCGWELMGFLLHLH